MTLSVVHLDIDARGVATATLDSPATFNGLDHALVCDMIEALDRCKSEAARVVRLRGAGKHFCAGANLKTLGAGTGTGGEQPPPLMRMLRQLNTMPIPTIALVHGACVGGGAALAACCDVVVAEESAYFAIPEVRLGIPPIALVHYLAAAIGPRQLRRYMLTGERFGGLESVQAGMVHRLCPNGDLLASAESIVDTLLRGGPLAITDVKRAVLELPLVISEEREAALQEFVMDRFASPEAREGVAAFLEKRSPNWYHASQGIDG